MRAILQSSGSQASGCKPFCTRASLVFSKAVRSIVLAFSKAGSETAAAAFAEVTAEFSATRLGLERLLLRELEISRATG